MRIVSWNVNGIRAWLKKDGLAWLDREKPDVFCIQEAKAMEDQITKKDRRAFADLGYEVYWHPAERKGYSGVVTFSREPALFVTRGVPFERGEGRVVVTEHGEFTLYNIYFPNGRQREDGQKNGPKGRTWSSPAIGTRRLPRSISRDRKKTKERPDSCRSSAKRSKRSSTAATSTRSDICIRRRISRGWRRPRGPTAGGPIERVRGTATSVGGSTINSSTGSFCPRSNGQKSGRT
jgi:hypothetical protein